MRLRYIKELERLKTTHNLSLEEFAKRIGYEKGETVSNLIAGRQRISLEWIVFTLEAFPDFDLWYVMASKEIPEVKITTLQGMRGKGKAGAKRKKRPAKRKKPATPKPPKLDLITNLSRAAI